MKHTEKEDIIDDLNFLDKSDILNERTRGKQVSRYSEALKKLKDRKSKLAQYEKGQKGPIDDYATKDSDMGINSVSGFDSEEEESEEESDFVVDDDMIDGEKTAVQEAMMELPPEFSKGRVLSFKRQLEIYIEYLVRLVLNPVFDSSTSTRYDLAKKAVMKRIQGYKDSIVTSDVWLSSFKSTVDKYSKWVQTKDIVYDYAMKCEACRSNKPAGVKIILSDINDEQDSTCCKKGEMYHYFKHFASHMFAKVKTIVEEMRNLGIQDPGSIHIQMLATGYIKMVKIYVSFLVYIFLFLYLSS
ncbi:uncharacterized protein B0P05DRAFT_547444 [Gilbertella persicaria]|uniref:uncharacterized protein n=1 Tax=Gilbertella persicaria TaxID=101096 RepID=UPI00221F64D6|nr:uncharacterized protein B0P05DRAFT_547444 [Gilbertella persicaria]KAI8075420.1 hypothetical protein B0P05DRAFT_547444 [Gilbertella persicaria]